MVFKKKCNVRDQHEQLQQNNIKGEHILLSKREKSPRVIKSDSESSDVLTELYYYKVDNFHNGSSFNNKGLDNQSYKGSIRTNMDICINQVRNNFYCNCFSFNKFIGARLYTAFIPTPAKGVWGFRQLLLLYNFLLLYLASICR